MYRTSFVELPRRPAEPGFVEDMVRQFADPYAFLRELVQNAIDAKATRIHVVIERTPEGRVTTATRDDGTGMTRATLEGPLLTLFSSTKEGDGAMIGKYGIGFVSVLASDPAHVEVATERDGAAHVLRLFGDHSYELEDAPARGVPGTTVTLVHTFGPEDFAHHVERSRAALRRFCRYARVPLDLTVHDASEPNGSGTSLINEDFVATGVVATFAEHDGARFALAVAAPDEPAFIGYYNRGLTLFESDTAEPELLGLRVLIDSAALAHTLSRDNVRRDRALRGLIAHAAKLARTTLRAALLAELETAAVTADDPSRIDALLRAAAQVVLECGDDPVVPLALPFRDRTVLSLHALRKHSPKGVWLVPAASMAARVLSRSGPVVRFPELYSALRQHLPVVRRAPAALEVAEGLTDVGASDTELLRSVHALLRHAPSPPRRVLFAAFEHKSARLFRTQVTADDCAVFDFDDAPDSGAPTLFFDGANPQVQDARRAAARGHASAAAQLLARLVLLESGPLPPETVDALLAGAS